MADKLESVVKYLQDYITSQVEEVEEAETDRDGSCDFGHPQDSFEAGWERGQTVGRDDMANTILNMLK